MQNPGSMSGSYFTDGFSSRNVFKTFEKRAPERATVSCLYKKVGVRKTSTVCRQFLFNFLFSQTEMPRKSLSRCVVHCLNPNRR